jgi:hypothetical protein
MDKQMWLIHPMKYYSAIKRNKVLTHAATQRKLEAMMLRKRSPANYMISPL